jgi:hypothetical protein
VRLKTKNYTEITEAQRTQSAMTMVVILSGFTPYKRRISPKKG